MPSVTTSVVIRCRNEEAHIGRLLTGLMRQRQRPDEIIVVDSGSTDATLPIASAFPIKLVSISPEDFSFGAACNVGCRESTADVVVFISAHCYPVHDTWLEQLAAPFEMPDIACSYGRQMGPPTAKFSEQRIFSTWYPARSQRRQRHPFSNNANAAVRRDLWKDLPYDEHLTGLEDLDWAKRAIAKGYLLSYVAEAPVVHVHEESFAQTLNRYRREAIAHKEIYDEQRMNALSALRLGAVNIARDFREARRLGVLPHQAAEIAKFRTAQFYGTYRGFGQQGPVPDLLRRRFFYPEQAETAEPDVPPVPAGSPIDYDEPFDPSKVR